MPRHASELRGSSLIFYFLLVQVKLTYVYELCHSYIYT